MSFQVNYDKERIDSLQPQTRIEIEFRYVFKF